MFERAATWVGTTPWNPDIVVCFVSSFSTQTSYKITIGAFTEMLQKYKLMEQSLTRQKFSLKTKVSDAAGWHVHVTAVLVVLACMSFHAIGGGGMHRQEETTV